MTLCLIKSDMLKREHAQHVNTQKGQFGERTEKTGIILHTY